MEVRFSQDDLAHCCRRDRPRRRIARTPRESVWPDPSRPCRSVPYLALIAFLGESCRIAIRGGDWVYTENSTILGSDSEVCSRWKTPASSFPSSLSDPAATPLGLLPVQSVTSREHQANVADQQWFYRNEQEWVAIAERLKQTVCPHCKTVGTLIRHGSLSGFDDSDSSQKVVRARRIFCSNRHRRRGLRRLWDARCRFLLLRHWQDRAERLAPRTFDAGPQHSLRGAVSTLAVQTLRIDLHRCFSQWGGRTLSNRFAASCRPRCCPSW